jgi:hypothetical protein
MMSILLVLFLPVSPLYLVFCNGFVVLVGSFLQCHFSVLDGLFISLNPDVSWSSHENQVLLLSVDLFHHSHHLGVVNFPHPIKSFEATQQIEIAVLIASGSA